MKDKEYITKTIESLYIAEEAWKVQIGKNTQTDRAKDGINQLSCVILAHKLKNSE